MACGVFHKASKGLWSKIKGAAKKVWGGVKHVAQKAAPVLNKR